MPLTVPDGNRGRQRKAGEVRRERHIPRPRLHLPGVGKEPGVDQHFQGSGPELNTKKSPTGQVGMGFRSRCWRRGLGLQVVPEGTGTPRTHRCREGRHGFTV